MCRCRLWFVYNTDLSRSALQNVTPAEIGYMNVIPKCVDTSAKYPVYENLPETYAAINTYLQESPLEGLTQLTNCIESQCLEVEYGLKNVSIYMNGREFIFI